MSERRTTRSGRSARTLKIWNLAHGEADAPPVDENLELGGANLDAAVAGEALRGVCVAGRRRVEDVTGHGPDPGSGAVACGDRDVSAV